MGKTPYTAMQIASEIMRQCNFENIGMTNLRLQMVLYYIQTKSLQDTGTPAFEDDFEAWRVGPVVRDVYNEFMRYIAFRIEFDDLEIEKNRIPVDSKTSHIVHEILVLTRDFGAWELSDRAKETEPYKRSYVVGMENVISKYEIKQFGKVNL